MTPEPTSHPPKGRAAVQIAPGAHICQIYTSDEERDELLYRLLAQGLLAKERCVCCSDHFEHDVAQKRWANKGIDSSAALESEQLTVYDCEQAYLPNGRFEPEAMLDFLTGLYDSSTRQGYPGVRIIGEMPADIQKAPGGERILEYECRVSMLLEEHPATAVCQYDARIFDGATILEVLKVHPVTITRGTALLNPLFVPPQDYLDASWNRA